MINVRVLFEDNEKSPISKILKSIFGDDVVFCETCNMFRSNIQLSLRGGVDLVVCYHDTPPDNKYAVKRFRELLQEFSSEPRVVILKAQAIEYYILRSLIEVDIIPDYKWLKEFKKSLVGIPISYTAHSYERFCKGVLNGNPKECLVNKSTYMSGWYNGDCCDFRSSIPEICKPFTESEKVLIIMYSLPYYPAYDRFQHLRDRGFLTHVSTEESVRICNQEFDAIKKSICN